MKDAAVSWCGVSKRYAEGMPLAVDDVTLEVGRGELLALLGTSGSGKTTLLKLVNRLTDPTSGVVRVEGRATTEWEVVGLRRRIGYVIQDVGLLPHLSVLDNVAVALRIRGEGWREGRRRGAERLELVGLDPATYGGRLPRELSGGQRQRVGVARVLWGIRG